MKYKLKKDLPFLKAESIVSYGCWTGGGLGMDRGETKYSCGGSSHNGIQVFENYENKLLESLFENKEWIILLPDSIEEALNLYDTKYFSMKEFISFVAKVR